MQHRDDKPGLRDAGKWVPPGGHRDEGEELVSCARRELEEETDYRCSELKLLTTLKPATVEEWPGCELYIYVTSYDGVQPVTCREGQALKFVKREEACYYPIPRVLLTVWDQALAINNHESRNNS